MNLKDAEDLARKLMSEWLDPRWKFAWTDARAKLGDCNYATRTIRLSRPYVALNERDLIEYVIRHEIAHALGKPEDGHGPNWKRNARLVGAKPVRCASETGLDVASPKARWRAVCPGCGDVTERHRLTAKVRNASACGACCTKYSFGRYDEKFKLTFRQVR